MAIDPYLFEQHFQAFQAFVEDASGEPLRSLHTHPYLDGRENYKTQINAIGRERLGWRSWKEFDVGSGRIALAAVHAIEIAKGPDTPRNNLVPWQGRWGDQGKPHGRLIELAELGQHELDRGGSAEAVTDVERALFDLFRSRVSDQTSFGRLVGLVGKKYSLLAYLFFLKNRTEYAPILTSKFEKAFRLLGVDLTLSHKASWENYSAYNGVLGELQALLEERTGAATSLLDAHSFAYTLVVAVYRDEPKSVEAKRAIESARKRAEQHSQLRAKDREAVGKARMGQGAFRDDLDAYWETCAVTGCANRALLRASHIKPWRDSNPREARDPYNGFLLSAAYDAAFDAGLISFDDGGRILFSSHLSATDAEAVGLRRDVSLREIDGRHKPYLRYHRSHVFRDT